MCRSKSHRCRSLGQAAFWLTTRELARLPCEREGLRRGRVRADGAALARHELANHFRQPAGDRHRGRSATRGRGDPAGITLRRHQPVRAHSRRARAARPRTPVELDRHTQAAHRRARADVALGPDPHGPGPPRHRHDHGRHRLPTKEPGGIRKRDYQYRWLRDATPYPSTDSKKHLECQHSSRAIESYSTPRVAFSRARRRDYLTNRYVAGSSLRIASIKP
ncbi:hypothetical protein BN6_21590 [Saccharothrix espanaensis DSM 44229]|uniref:Uncharacterized protein n=1 Tax=Saccharothrix espanaensis (strain ATCC 51144 / DSM 44229 / JCM 9112 / NBRC 15066 / NRRL 15764) TaxID=1179773 RepID=K0JU80_SACES|nr:hypothetical protein BN6_21590 [Saccharothrix espanaensis DSM 44229]